MTVEKKHYHVTRNTASNISRSTNREVSNTEGSDQAFSTAEVILAFPLTDDSQPITETGKQQLFAFLPVRMSDFKVISMSASRQRNSSILLTFYLFKFIIQSDFDTSANRQDIVTTSRRNTDLLDGIAVTFVKAAVQFCEHDDLCYTWPSFLPLAEDGSSSSFWAGLMPKIKSLLSTTPVLRSRHHNYLRLIRDVRIMATGADDSDGNPLFDDASLDLYISKRYSWPSWMALKEYGLSVVYVHEILDSLGVDLKSSTSKMKAESTDAECGTQRQLSFC